LANPFHRDAAEYAEGNQNLMRGASFRLSMDWHKKAIFHDEL